MTWAWAVTFVLFGALAYGAKCCCQGCVACNRAPPEVLYFDLSGYSGNPGYCDTCNWVGTAIELGSGTPVDNADLPAGISDSVDGTACVWTGLIEFDDAESCEYDCDDCESEWGFSPYYPDDTTNCDTDEDCEIAAQWGYLGCTTCATTGGCDIQDPGIAGAGIGCDTTDPGYQFCYHASGVPPLILACIQPDDLPVAVYIYKSTGGDVKLYAIWTDPNGKEYYATSNLGSFGATNRCASFSVSPTPAAVTGDPPPNSFCSQGALSVTINT